jgi:hypothetical protein
MIKRALFRIISILPHGNFSAWQCPIADGTRKKLSFQRGGPPGMRFSCHWLDASCLSSLVRQHAAKQSSYAWLRLCLIDLEKAIAPTELRDLDFRVPDSSVGDAKYAHLINAVKALKQELTPRLD